MFWRACREEDQHGFCSWLVGGVGFGIGWQFPAFCRSAVTYPKPSTVSPKPKTRNRIHLREKPNKEGLGVAENISEINSSSPYYIRRFGGVFLNSLPVERWDYEKQGTLRFSPCFLLDVLQSTPEEPF